MAELFKPEDLHFEGMDLEVAKDWATRLIHESNTKATKKQNLLRDISNAPTVVEVQRIMWQSMLSGSGLGTIGSKWQSLHKLASG